MRKKKSYKRCQHYYDPGTKPQPRKVIEGGTTAKIVQNTRQLRRAQQRGG